MSTQFAGTSPKPESFGWCLGEPSSLESNIGLQILSGLTLMVIPAYGEQVFDVSVTATRIDLPGKEFVASAKDGIEEWIQILLLPATPFALVADRNTMVRVNDSLLAQLQEQGAFADPAAGYERPSTVSEILETGKAPSRRKRGPRRR